MISPFSLGVSAGGGEERRFPPLPSHQRETRPERGEVVLAKGWLGIYYRMKAGGREVGGQASRHVKDKVGFTGIGFPKESTSLTRNNKVR